MEGHLQNHYWTKFDNVALDDLNKKSLDCLKSWLPVWIPLVQVPPGFGTTVLVTPGQGTPSLGTPGLGIPGLGTSSLGTPSLGIFSLAKSSSKGTFQYIGEKTPPCGVPRQSFLFTFEHKRSELVTLLVTQDSYQNTKWSGNPLFSWQLKPFQF